MFAYIPKEDIYIKIFIPYLSFKFSWISNILKNGWKDIIKYFLEIDKKYYTNKKQNNVLIYSFTKWEIHNINKDVIEEWIKNVFSYLK